MKAIAIVEILDGGKGKWYIDGEIHYTEDESLMKKFDVEMIPLKPMPKRVGEISYDFAYGWSKTFDQFIESQTKIEWMAKGWNACIEELEK